MATTVSAVESKSIVYNLVRTVKINNNGEVTLKATFPNVPLVNGQYIDIIVSGLDGKLQLKDKNGDIKTVDSYNTKVTISGQYIDTNKAINPIVVCRNLWSSDISYANKYLLGWENGNAWNGDTIRVPVKEINDGTPAFIGGDAAASPEIPANVTATTTITSGTIEITNPDFTAAKLPKGTTTLEYKATRAKVNAAGEAFNKTTDITGTAGPGGGPTWAAESDATIQAAMKAIAVANGWDKLTDGSKHLIDAESVNVTDATQKVRYQYVSPTAETPEKAEGWYDKNDNPVNLGSLGVAITAGTAAAGNKITLEVSPYEPAKGNVMANITVTATIPGLPDLGEVWDASTKCPDGSDYDNITELVANGTLNISLKNDSTNDASVAVKGDCTMSNYKRADKVEQYPMMTNQSGDILENVKAGYKDASGNDVYKTVAIHDDIFAYLANEYVNGDKGYKNVMAVVNDAVENYGIKFSRTPIRRVLLDSFKRRCHVDLF